MRQFQFFACAAMAAAISACTSGGTPVPVINTPAGLAAATNSTMGPISFGNPSNGGAQSEDFSSSTTSLTLTNNGVGFEYAAKTEGGFENPDTVSFDAVSNTLTFNVVQGDIAFTDTIGPIVLADPGDFTNLQNDNLAILIAAFPDQFPTPAQAGFPSVNFNPNSFIGNAAAADAALIALQQQAGAANPDIGNYLAAIAAVADARIARDFFAYLGSNGTQYFQLKTIGTNSGTVTNYVALGVWQRPPEAGFTGTDAYGATIFGQLTPDHEIPESGTATYTSTIVGWLLRNNSLEELRGSVFLNVNFGAHTVDASVDADTVAINANGDAIFTDVTTLSGEGFLETSNRFNGPLIGDTDPTLRGQFEGAFFGPAAAEVGGTFTFSNSDMAASAGYVGAREGTN